MVLSACMMLDHIGESEKATRIRAAISAVLADGTVRTYDMMKMAGNAEVIGKGAATTQQVTDAIIAKL